MAQQGRIKAKSNAPITIAIAVVLILGVLAYAYMFNHFTTEELAKFALIKYLFN